MFSWKTLAGTTLLTVALYAPAHAAAFYATDFDSYGIGSVVGQDGWVDDSSAIQPQPDVMLDPTGSGHGNVLHLESINADDSTWTGCYRPTGDIPLIANPKFSVSWDQYRASTGDNLWFAEDISYGDWFGLEWDASGTIQPQFTSDGEIPLVAGKWQNIQIDFDYTGRTIEGFVDGVSGGRKVLSESFSHWRGLDLEVVGTESKGGNNGPNYIDNVRVFGEPAIPEPGSLALLASGFLPLLGLRRKRG